MTDRFDPNIPPAGPTDPAIEGEFTGIVAITERPTLGKSNLVVNADEPFNIEVAWHVKGNLVPLWLTALLVNTQGLGRDSLCRVAGPRRREEPRRSESPRRRAAVLAGRGVHGQAHCARRHAERGEPRRPDPVGYLQA
jgi:hypothetical protein